MTDHPVQVPNPCVPYPQLDPVTGPLIHLATNLSAIYAETACSGVPVKTGKEKSAVTTYLHHFIATMKIEVAPVPKNTVPMKAVQLSSVGPVPPAVAADSPAAAESPAQEDGDQILLNFSPHTTVTTLEYPGLATIFLCPSGPDNQQSLAHHGYCKNEACQQ